MKKNNRLLSKDEELSDSGLNKEKKINEEVKNESSDILDIDYDNVTGLLNHSGFILKIDDYLKNNPDDNYNIVLIKIDNLDTCIDSLSDNDKVLKIIGDKLSLFSVDDKDILLSYLGRDIFCFSFLGKNKEEIEEISNILLEKIRKINISINSENTIFTTASIGISEKKASSSINEIINKGFSASLVAENKGGNRVVIWDKEIIDYKEIRNIVEIALKSGDWKFELYHQKIIPSNKKEELYYEILLRLKDEDGNFIGPDKFIPISEDLGLSPRIDTWVIENTFSWLVNNPEHLNVLSRCSINLSGPSISDKNAKDFIGKILEKYDISPEKICFEITETGKISDKEVAEDNIRFLKEKGFSLAIDDFGKGYSSHEKMLGSYNAVKIDGEFIKGLINNSELDNTKYQIIKGICELAKTIGIKVVAEYVNGEETELLLRKLGVDYFQGYESSGKPQPLINLLR